eukprot:TRINITY_DN6812_c0_g1_i1.p1 TRINITY_DN6812_c0_g1~~TRINITY_DN6812_c0_g1_i1.p1  ORF type:complete len:378 (-),score=140.02 TRINITY_DN6812_c0_g1_i1:796-1929(-)
MSMSQEEIESLMNGLDFDEAEASEESTDDKTESQDNVSEDDINELIAQTADISSNDEKESESEESVDDILNNFESSSDDVTSDETNIDDIIKELENTEPETSKEEPTVEVSEVQESTTIDDEIISSNETVTNDNLDELLSSIDGIVDDEPVASSQPEPEPVQETVSEPEPQPVPEPTPAPKVESSSEPKGDDLNLKIDSGVFPFPVEEDTKVVNQLSAVANDSEEKATKIFDVLSNILDYNNAIQQDVKALTAFHEKELAMLNSLGQKFPNISVFQENLKQANAMGEYIKDIGNKLNEGNTEIFQAMELMQYHDINRQKIERVMSVIKKLTIYLNNLFEDDTSRPEVAVAKHIHGDGNTDDLLATDDLEALIAEFSK